MAKLEKINSSDCKHHSLTVSIKATWGLSLRLLLLSFFLELCKRLYPGKFRIVKMDTDDEFENKKIVAWRGTVDMLVGENKRLMALVEYVNKDKVIDVDLSDINALWQPPHDASVTLEDEPPAPRPTSLPQPGDSYPYSRAECVLPNKVCESPIRCKQFGICHRIYRSCERMPKGGENIKPVGQRPEPPPAPPRPRS